MTAKEVEAKASQELENVEEESQQPQAVEPVSARVNAYLGAERALYARMNECLGPNVQIMTHKRAGDVEYDAILRLRSRERVIVEIKYIRKGFNLGWLAESVNELTAKKGALRQQVWNYLTRSSHHHPRITEQHFCREN